MSEKKSKNTSAGAAAPNGGAKPGEKKPAEKRADGKEEKKEEELSEEDRRLKEDLELCVTRVSDPQPELVRLALDTLRREIRTSTSSMTAVPKPLKFLRPHYDTLKGYYEATPDGNNKRLLSDILSVLAMTMAKERTRESLHFALSGTHEAPGSWGMEYVRNLAGEIAQEYTHRQEAKQSIDDLLGLVDEIVPFHMKHNAEPDACDLLMEIERLDSIVRYTDENNYQRVCLYLLSCAQYTAEPEDAKVLRVALDIYRKMNKYPEAMLVALRLGDRGLIKELLDSCHDRDTKRQLAYILSRQYLFTLDPRPSDGSLDDSEVDTLNSILWNTKLSEHYLALALDLEVSEPKSPEDIYKTHLSETRTTFGGAQVDSARQNLASTFVNAFVNAGFGNDKLLLTGEPDAANKWLFKNKDHGMMSAAASLGMLNLWNVDNINELDRFTYSQEDYIKAGALLAIGLCNCGVKNDCDPAFALLADHVADPKSANMRIGAILGLGLAYAGSAKDEVSGLLLPIMEDPGVTMETLGITALALGLAFVGTANSELTDVIVQALMMRDEASLGSTYTRFVCLGLGLLYLGRGEVVDVLMETLKVLPAESVGKYATLTVETCAYIASGNVLKVQRLLAICGEHPEKEKTEAGPLHAYHAVATLGIALIAMGEELGADMALRSYNHLLQYGEPAVRRAVPIALGLLSVSNPRVTVADTLSKLSHDADAEVAYGAIIALGMIGAGTNNSRIGGMLRQLATYYYKEANHLFMVRLAQGLLHLGKGLISLTPFHAGGTVLQPVAAAGLLAVLHALLDTKNLIFGKSHYLLYCLACAMYPRMLITLDEDLKPLNVPVRVGQAVDTVGQAGKPKTITGFQTHTSPVLLGAGERAELATDEYLPVSPSLENFVILKKNPNYVKEEGK